MPRMQAAGGRSRPVSISTTPASPICQPCGRPAWAVRARGPGSPQNITDGVARNGHVEVALTVPDDFSDATLTRLAGGIDGTGLTVHWLRPVPPITGGEARLNFLTPDRRRCWSPRASRAGS